MDKKEPVYVRYVELTPLGIQTLDEMECKHRSKPISGPIGDFYCKRFKLLIALSACAVCKELEEERGGE